MAGGAWDPDPYQIRGSRVLRNKLNIEDAAELSRKERLLVSDRALERVPTGRFDLSHLQDIHRHLFQDVYDWAGEIRIRNYEKDGDRFHESHLVTIAMADVHRGLAKKKFLRGLTPADFSLQAGRVIGDVNYIHPFREGNGRTQLQYLKQLAAQAGHPINLADLTRKSERWIEASKASNIGDYSMMAEAIRDAIKSRRGIETDRSR